ncbi:hypothetical protein [Halalkalicoccus subterraneus]|uniref:hypothetical protein n=1 Tax=Halalkalicoccus subterraneus TaxID=2675002 RepID=UPI0013CF378E|nr:hypothetical protein [Halalkalicoccus subterraneus]
MNIEIERIAGVNCQVIISLQSSAQLEVRVGDERLLSLVITLCNNRRWWNETVAQGPHLGEFVRQ